MRSEARFRYRFLLIPAYRYDHSAAERWSGDCLLGLDADTVTNGDRVRVSGEREGDRLGRGLAGARVVVAPERVGDLGLGADAQEVEHPQNARGSTPAHG